MNALAELTDITSMMDIAHLSVFTVFLWRTELTLLRTLMWFDHDVEWPHTEYCRCNTCRQNGAVAGGLAEEVLRDLGDIGRGDL